MTMKMVCCFKIMKEGWLQKVITMMMIVVVVTSKECTEEELNAAQIKFKDCMDEKKASLLQTEDEVQDMICTGLKDLSTGCKEPVTQFAICRGREFVDNLVAIHLNAMSGKKTFIFFSFLGGGHLLIKFCSGFYGYEYSLTHVPYFQKC